MYSEQVGKYLQLFPNKGEIIYLYASINVIEDSESSLIKATQNLVNAKKYLKEGRGSLFNRAEQMRNLGANNKKDLN